MAPVSQTPLYNLALCNLNDPKMLLVQYMLQQQYNTNNLSVFGNQTQQNGTLQGLPYFGKMTEQTYMNEMQRCQSYMNLMPNYAQERMAQLTEAWLRQNGSSQTTERQISQNNNFSTGGFSIEDANKCFEAIDANGSGKISWNEYLDYYIAQKENQLGKTLGQNKNSPEYVKYRQEARNMFNAFKTQGNAEERGITKERFAKILNLFDRLDGSKDKNIDMNVWQRAIASILENGASAIITNGKTLRDLIG